MGIIKVQRRPIIEMIHPYEREDSRFQSSTSILLLKQPPTLRQNKQTVLRSKIQAFMIKFKKQIRVRNVKSGTG